jgi:hypothetical protein
MNAKIEKSEKTCQKKADKRIRAGSTQQPQPMFRDCCHVIHVICDRCPAVREVFVVLLGKVPSMQELFLMILQNTVVGIRNINGGNSALP